MVIQNYILVVGAVGSKGVEMSQLCVSCNEHTTSGYPTRGGIMCDSCYEQWRRHLSIDAYDQNCSVARKRLLKKERTEPRHRFDGKKEI